MKAPGIKEMGALGLQMSIVPKKNETSSWA